MAQFKHLPRSFCAPFTPRINMEPKRKVHQTESSSKSQSVCGFQCESAGEQLVFIMVRFHCVLDDQADAVGQQSGLGNVSKVNRVRHASV